jgi:hypothetical protein
MQLINQAKGKVKEEREARKAEKKQLRVQESKGAELLSLDARYSCQTNDNGRHDAKS